MTALWEFAKAAIELLPGSPGMEPLGRVVPVSGLTTLTVVSATQLAYGGVDEQAYAQKWIWRPLTASDADRIRFSDSFAPGTGTLTHSGTNYSDTTATSEYAIISPFSPQAWRIAIQNAITKTMGLDETIVPIVQGQEWHWLHELDWLKAPSQIRKVERNQSPVITRNRYLQKRHSYDSAGLFLPDYWTVTSNAAATPFLSTNAGTPALNRGAKYYYSLERSGGTDASLLQEVDVNRAGVAGEQPVGQAITGVAIVDPDSAGDILVSLYSDDGSVSDTSTGSGGGRQVITVSVTLPETANGVRLFVTAQNNNAAQNVFQAYALIGDLHDAVRRDNYPRSLLRTDQYHFEQGGPLKVHNPSMGRGQIIVTSERPYPAFDATRFGSGAADTDESDAPADVVAVGAIFYLFRGKFGDGHPDTKVWERKFDSLRLSHMAADTDAGHAGFRMLGSPVAAPARYVR